MGGLEGRRKSWEVTLWEVRESYKFSNLRKQGNVYYFEHYSRKSIETSAEGQRQEGDRIASHNVKEEA